MSDAMLARLCAESGLSRDDVAFLGQFDDAQLSAFSEAYVHGRDKRDRDLAEAVDNGLKVLPFMLRPAVKKILGA